MIDPPFTLRVNFTQEDKAAKGLRSLREPAAAPHPPVHFTAAEMDEMYPRLLLLGARGAGKSQLARQLAAERGASLIEIAGPHSLAAAPPAGSIILDGIDRLGVGGEALLADYLILLGDRPVLMLGDAATIRNWRTPTGFAVHTLLPLSLEERQAYLDAHHSTAEVPLTPAAANPALFQLALTIKGAVASAEELVDRFIEDQPEQAEAAFKAVANGVSRNRAVDDLSAARHLMQLDPVAIASLFLADPDIWSPSLASLLRRDSAAVVRLSPLLTVGNCDAALRAALLLAVSPTPDITAKLLTLIETGRLSPFDRDQAARTLAVWGDPRDLEALCDIPAGNLVMGSTTNPNSQPVHALDVPGFRIGRFPVTNCLYARFVTATGRRWTSLEADMPERRNAPATDLTWRDARAYCDWLTKEWRAAGRIAAGQTVRLPTEPEWERAARGDQPDGGDEIVYPWGQGWNAAAVNSEETGFNAQCAVGLFPTGASPYGCLDMAGQIWEWTSTLWGDDMAIPHFRYPYCDDGREDQEAGPKIRRVLRGGCFSSTRLKACCTYRGSLEPHGAWRGNGFRIVVA